MIFLFFLSALISCIKLSAACPASGNPMDANGVSRVETGCDVSVAGLFAVSAENAGTIDFSDGTITVTAGGIGAFVTDSGSQITLNNITTDVSGGSQGIAAQSTGKVFYNGGTLTVTNGPNSVQVGNNGSEVTLNNVTVNGVNSTGVFALAAGKFFSTGSSIAISGNNLGAVIAADPNSQAQLNTTSVSTSGTDSFALDASSSGTINYSNGTVSTTGINGRGAYSHVTGTINLDNATIQTAGGGAFATFVSSNSTINLNESTLLTTAGGSHGLYAEANGIIDFTQGSVTTTSDNSNGALALNTSTITLDSVSIETSGTASHGAFANGGGATGGNLNFTQTSISTTGSGAFGVELLEGFTGTLASSSIQTTGANSDGIRLVAFGTPNQMTLTNSSVATTGADARALYMESQPGIGNQSLQATDTAFSATAADVIVINGGQETLSFNHVSAEASNGNNLMSVSNSVVPSAVTWTAQNSILSGNVAMNTLTGTLDTTLSNQTIWTGAAQNITNLTNNNSIWNLTTNSNITNTLTNAGLINFVQSGNIFKNLVVSGNYVGQSGALALNTFLGADGSPSDHLVLSGASATGNTLLTIRNTTGPGAQTVGDGILVIDATAGTTTPGSFALNNKVVAGFYQYSLFRGNISGTDPNSWFLRSALVPAPPFTAEGSLYSAVPSLALLYGRFMLGTFHDRLGEQKFSDPCSCCVNTGFWVRALNQGGSQSNGGVFRHGPNFDYQLVAVELGRDFLRHESPNGSFDCVGLLGAVGTAHATVDSFDGSVAGKENFDGYTGGIYWTHFGPSGWYLDAVVQGNWYRQIDAHAEEVIELDGDGVDATASLEGGYPLKCSFLHLEPQAQLVYQSISIHDASYRVNFRKTHSTAGRIGLRVFEGWNICRRFFFTWLRASFWHDFQGRSQTLFPFVDGPVGVTSDLGGSWLEADVGLTTQLGKKLWFYGSFGGNFYVGGRGRAYTAIGGLRTTF